MSTKKIEKKTAPKKAVKKVALNQKIEKKTVAKKIEKPPIIARQVVKKTIAKKVVKKVASKEIVKQAAKKTTKAPVAKKDPLEKLVDAVVYGMQEKKAEKVVTINLKNLKNSVADYFIIGQCESKTQAYAIADSVEEQVFKKTGEVPFHKEGRENAEWILLDYFNVVVHIFLREQREFYNLERLWGDADIKNVKEGK